MIINLLILVFILFMAYWWGRQGLFSAFLHLLATVVAGAIALALWEPLVIHWLLGRIPAYAWGIGLLAPFILALILLRLVLDRSVPGNVYFSPISNYIGGGILGVMAAILSAGMAVIGIGFLDVGPDLAGYEPLIVSSDGTLTEQSGGSLWIPVDHQAASFFSMLSGGSFYGGAAMPLYQPDLATQASLFRMKYDQNSSVTASPQSVAVSAMGVFATPLRGVDDAVVKNIGTNAQVANYKIVVVDTAWTPGDGTFDGDSTLRVFPTQIRLLTAAIGSSGNPDVDPQLEAPIGVSLAVSNPRLRTYVSLRDSHSFASADQRGTLGWVFIIAGDRVPRAIFVRHLRLDLPAPTDIATEPAAAAAMFGIIPFASDTTTTAQTEAPVTPNVGTQTGANPGGAANVLDVSNELPVGISMNIGHALVYEGTLVKSGRDSIAPPSGFIPPGVRASAILTYPSHTMVRMKVEAQKAQSLLGASRVDAASLGAVTIEDSGGNQYFPMGYAWLKQDGVLDVYINRDQEIRSARELPVSQMNSKDTLDVYFTVPHKVQITKIHYGQAAQDANLQVP